MTDINGDNSNLFSVNETTGAATLIGGVGFALESIVYSNGTLYAFTSASNPIISIDTSTGAGTAGADQDSALGIVNGAAPVAVPEPNSFVLVGLTLAVSSCCWRLSHTRSEGPKQQKRLQGKRSEGYFSTFGA